MQKKLIVFGGTGFVGSVVVRKALQRNFKVIVASRSGLPLPGTPLQHLVHRVKQIGGVAAAREATHQNFWHRLFPHSAERAQTHHDNQTNTKRTQHIVNEKETQVTKQANSDEDQDNEQSHGGNSSLNALQFVSINASNRAQVFDFFNDNPDTYAVISCVGKLTRNYELALQMNGNVNANIAAGVYHNRLIQHVRKFVYISAQPFNKYLPFVFQRKATLKGYFHGKAIAEKAITENLGPKGVVLRPGMIYGVRHVVLPLPIEVSGINSVTLALPLNLIGLPLDYLLRAVHGTKLFTPPVHVQIVAQAAIRACEWNDKVEDPQMKNVNNSNLAPIISGIVDVYGMHDICNRSNEVYSKVHRSQRTLQEQKATL